MDSNQTVVIKTIGAAVLALIVTYSIVEFGVIKSLMLGISPFVAIWAVVMFSAIIIIAIFFIKDLIKSLWELLLGVPEFRFPRYESLSDAIGRIMLSIVATIMTVASLAFFFFLCYLIIGKFI